MPNLENIAKWADALESGEYLQGRHKLHDVNENTWCCLGVACDVARKNGIDITMGMIRSSVGYSGIHAETFDGESEYLPPKVQEWLGLDTHNPYLGGTAATEINDYQDKKFPTIAAMIRAEYGVNGGTA